MKYFLPLFTIFISPLTFAFSGNLVTAVEFKELRASTYEGRYLSLSVVQKKLTETLDLTAGLARLSRTFPDGVQFNELNYSLGFVQLPSQSFYLDGQLDISPGADILPQESGTLTGHWILPRGEFGLGVNYRQYQTIKSGYLHPSYYLDVTDKFGISVGSFFSKTDSVITAYHGALIYKFNSRESLRADLASGRTLEDAGLEADFDSLTVAYSIRFGKLILLPSYSRYKSTIRTEDAYGLRLEYR